MKEAYLFVHFKEKRTPDGEQVYFAVSRDGFHWETVNDGNPVLWSYEGDKGVRDFTITRTKENKFVILATDLSLAYGMPYKYKNSWNEVSRNGSKCLVMWQSDDLIHWSDQRMIRVGNDNFGCVWAPDIIYDKGNDNYVIHWSSSHKSNDYGPKSIYYCRTKDFETFSEPQVLYSGEPGCPVIDSAMYEEDGVYYCFVKGEKATKEHRASVYLVKGPSVTGPFTRVDAFDESIAEIQEGRYEAPTAFKTADGRWCLMLDFYGCSAEEQGYVPFLADTLASGKFVRSDSEFSFPYGFKHGTVLKITGEEYERLKAYKKLPSER